MRYPNPKKKIQIIIDCLSDNNIKQFNYPLIATNPWDYIKSAKKYDISAATQNIEVVI